MPKETENTLFEKYNCCVVIPTYNNSKTLRSVIEGILKYTQKIIVVNDGSTDNSEEILKDFNYLEVISYSKNQGKGYALRKGFDRAIELGYLYAITIDSDGQHNVNDIPKFFECMSENKNILILGERNMNQEGIPLKSNFGRKFSNFWFKVETGITRDDTQTGFRLYPLELIRKTKFFTRKFEFEIEVLVRLAWKGCKIAGVPVSVHYFPEAERVSHFRPLKDFSRISVLNTILVTLTLLYILPRNLIRKITYKSIKNFINENIIHSKDSNLKISLSIALGVFVGILPIWGYQIMAVLFLAFVLRLNKIIAFAASNISIPPMIPFILYGSVYLGSMALGKNLQPVFSVSAFEFSNLKKFLEEYVVGSIILSTVTSLVLGTISFITLSLFRKVKRLEN